MRKIEKPVYATYVKTMKLRLTDEMENYVKMKALEQHTTASEVIRAALNNYLNRNISDMEIIHTTLSENTRKIKFLENKIEILALMVTQQTKFIMKSFPSNVNSGKSNEMIEKEFDEFKKDCMKTAKSNRVGLLESMLLDAYTEIQEQA